MWLAADRISGLSDGDPVGTWSDLSGSGNDCTSAGGARPTFKAAVLGGKPVVRFDGATSTMVVPNGVTYNRLNCALYFVMVPSALGSWQIPYAATTLGMMVHFNGGGGISGFGGYGGSTYFGVSDTWPNAEWRIGSVRVTNGVVQTEVSGLGKTAAATVATGTVTGGTLCSYNTGYWFPGDIAEILIFGGALSDENHARVVDYLGAKWGLSQGYRIVACAGDSMTAGLGLGPSETYPAQLQAAKGSGFRVVNRGVSARTVVDMTTAAPGEVDALARAVASPTRSVCVLFGGRNDLVAGANDTTTYNRIVTYCQARRTAGWKVVMVTIPPTGGADGNYETYRASVNASIRANLATFADAIADLAADPRMGDAGDNLDTTYYRDPVHPSATGAGVIAGLVSAAIDTIEAA